MNTHRREIESRSEIFLPLPKNKLSREISLKKIKKMFFEQPIEIQIKIWNHLEPQEKINLVLSNKHECPECFGNTLNQILCPNNFEVARLLNMTRPIDLEEINCPVCTWLWLSKEFGGQVAHGPPGANRYHWFGHQPHKNELILVQDEHTNRLRLF